MLQRVGRFRPRRWVVSSLRLSAVRVLVPRILFPYVVGVIQDGGRLPLPSPTRHSDFHIPERESL